IADPKNNSVSWLMPFLTELGLSNPRDLLVYGSVFLIFTFLIKNSFLSLFYYFQSKFAHNKYKDISIKIFEGYIHAPYSYHVDNNPSHLTQNVTVETYFLLKEIMLPILGIVMEGTMIIGVVLFLFIVEPFITIIALVFLGGIGGLLLKNLKQK